MELQSIADSLRQEVISLHRDRQLPHIGSALSCLDVMVALYFDVMTAEDTFILSKGHAGTALYSVQHRKGLIPDNLYEGIGRNGSPLAEHTSYPEGMVKLGSLGNGLGIGVGMAMANKMDGSRGKVYVLLSDGEVQEGSTLEGLWIAGRFRLGNLVAIVDYNRWQAYDRTEDVLPLACTDKAASGYGWSAKHVMDGNDTQKMAVELGSLAAGTPNLLIAHTTLGKGLPNEDDLSTHYKPPS